MKKLYWDSIEYDKQKIFFTVSDKGLTFVSSPGKKLSEIFDFYSGNQYNYEFKYEEEKTIETRIQLLEYFNGSKKENFDLPIDLEGFGTDLQKQILQAVSKIPYGQTKSYQAIAHEIGNPKAIQAVAHAIALNPILFVIPCHRVIKSNGEIGDYRGGKEFKQTLIEFEKQNLTKSTVTKKRVFTKISQLNKADH